MSEKETILKRNKLLEFAKKNRGVVLASQVRDLQSSREGLCCLVRSGELVRISRGVYALPEVWEDELWVLQQRFKKGIYSGNTALFLWELTDRTPEKYQMTFPVAYNLSRVKNANVDCVQHLDKIYNEGITEVQTGFGFMVRAYCPEQVLCDILRVRSKTDIQIVTDAFKRYVALPKRDIVKLSYFGKLFKVEKSLRSYLEVLL